MQQGYCAIKRLCDFRAARGFEMHATELLGCRMFMVRNLRKSRRGQQDNDKSKHRLHRLIHDDPSATAVEQPDTLLPDRMRIHWPLKGNEQHAILVRVAGRVVRQVRRPVGIRARRQHHRCLSLVADLHFAGHKYHTFR